MGFSYLKDCYWVNISREERLFCAHLYWRIRGNVRKFIKWLNGIEPLFGKNCLNLSLDDRWEVGYEVCFYRDYLKKFNSKRSIKNTEYPPKRTFDLCLFSKNRIVIIEAKVQQGFESSQLKKFDMDKEKMKKLLKECGYAKDICIDLVGLYSSIYKPDDSVCKKFDAMFTWEMVSKLYEEDDIIKKADVLYRQ